MPWVGFEPTIAASERAKTVHALDRSTTVTGHSTHLLRKNFSTILLWTKYLLGYNAMYFNKNRRFGETFRFNLWRRRISRARNQHETGRNTLLAMCSNINFFSLFFFIWWFRSLCSLQWLHGLRHELSLLARKLGSCVRISLKAWMSVCVYSVFVFFCVQVEALRRADPPSKESYQMCKD
jgi:hypothetical protein